MNFINRICRAIVLVTATTIIALAALGFAAYQAAPDAVAAAYCEVATNNFADRFECRNTHNL